MSYGLRVLKANGALAFDTTQQTGMVFVGSVVIPVAGANGTTNYSYSYPEWTGRTGRAVFFDGKGIPALTATWSYPGGVPTVNFARLQQNLATDNVTFAAHIFML